MYLLICPGETIICPGGTLICPVGTLVCPRETFICSVGTLICPVGTLIYPGGTLICPLTGVIKQLRYSWCGWRYHIQLLIEPRGHVPGVIFVQRQAEFRDGKTEVKQV